MLNDYIEAKKELEKQLTKWKDDNYTREILKEIDLYIENIISEIQREDIISDKMSVLHENFLKEVTVFLNICKNKKGNIEKQDIRFSIKIIEELIKEIDKETEKICQAEITDANAEMKVLESILKEDGYLNNNIERGIKNGKSKK